MTELTIECADCRHSHTAHRKNAKYCGVCRLFRDLIYLGGRRSRCASCDEKFAPLNVNDRLCATCDLEMHPPKDLGDCALCDAENTVLVRPGIAVCVTCAKDPKHRDVFTRAVGKKRKTRMEEGS